jgi:putative hydrolase
MRLLADLHTHTVASGHAYSTVTELAASAAERGLELIAVTDHGPAIPGGAHPWHFWNMKVMPHEMSGVRLLTGCEANPVPDTENGIDLPDEILAALDFVAVGFHPFTGWDEADPADVTAHMLRVLENPLVDMITHPGNAQFPVDMAEVSAAAAAHNVILELNDHSFAPDSARAGSSEREAEFAAAAYAAGAPIAIGSDAHFHGNVGDFEQAIAAATAIGIPQDGVVNRDAAAVIEFLTARRPRARLAPVAGA